MGQLWTEDGKTVAPQVLHDIVYERYVISRKCATSYVDTGNITPLERKMLIKFIVDEIQLTQELAEQQKQQLQHRDT